MKVNGKDVASGLILLLTAGIGYWLNLEHNLGIARRMGPGYMPMLVFVILAALGALVLIFGLFNGPDRLERWTGINTTTVAAAIAAGFAALYLSRAIAPGFFATGYNDLGIGMLVGFLVITWDPRWRLIGFICAALCIFCLLLERGGLLLAVTAAILVSCAAEPEHRMRPLGVLGMIVFLLALCWWVFIKQLDIRVSVWPQF